MNNLLFTIQFNCGSKILYVFTPLSIYFTNYLLSKYMNKRAFIVNIESLLLKSIRGKN